MAPNGKFPQLVEKHAVGPNIEACFLDHILLQLAGLRDSRRFQQDINEFSAAFPWLISKFPPLLFCGGEALETGPPLLE